MGWSDLKNEKIKNGEEASCAMQTGGFPVFFSAQMRLALSGSRLRVGKGYVDVPVFLLCPTPASLVHTRECLAFGVVEPS